MTPDESIRRGRFDRLKSAAIVLACLVLSVLLLRSWLGTEHQIPAASNVPAPEAERFAEASGPHPSVDAPGARENSESQQTAKTGSRPKKENRTAPLPRETSRSGQPEAPPPLAPPLPAKAPPSDQEVPRSPANTDPRGWSAPAAAPAPVWPRPSEPVARAAD